MNVDELKDLMKKKRISAVTRAFLLHICKPKSYFILDRHVFRSFYYVEYNKIYKKQVTDKIIDGELYTEYIDFIHQLIQITKRPYKDIDSALMIFGQVLSKVGQLGKLRIDESLNISVEIVDKV